MNDNWPGTKNAAGVCERLISMVPPHGVFVSAFAGHCAVGCRMRPARRRVFIDRDSAALEFWRARDPAAECYLGDGVAWLRHEFRLDAFGVAPPKRPDAFVFIDPPYYPGTCGRGIYRFELSAAEHDELLRTARAVPAPVMLCGYRCDQYDAALADWRRVDYRVMTRGGVKIESVWLNYSPPPVLHDPRFIGRDKRERERIRRRQRNVLGLLERMAPAEALALVDAINVAAAEGFRAGAMGAELLRPPASASQPSGEAVFDELHGWRPLGDVVAPDGSPRGQVLWIPGLSHDVAPLDPPRPPWTLR